MVIDSDDKLPRKAKALFDESVETLDAARLSELNRARQRALAELDRGRAGSWSTTLLPAGGAAAVAVIAVLMFGTAEREVGLPTGLPTAGSDFEMLIEASNLDMLEELEFFAWLELEEAGDAGHSG